MRGPARMQGNFQFQIASGASSRFNRPEARMKYSTKIFLSITVIFATLRPLYAQLISDDESKINSNLGLVVSAPLSTTADVVNSGWGAAAGVGYNFNRRNALIGEFMWNRLSPNGQQLQPLSAALQASNLDGNSDLYVISGNYRF